MKSLNRLFLTLALCVLPVAGFTGCKTAPSQRSVEVTTLKILGASVDSSMKIAAKMYHDGKLTDAQWGQIAMFHDAKLLPAYNLAVAAVQANLDSIASPDLIALSQSLATLIASYAPAK